MADMNQPTTAIEGMDAVMEYDKEAENLTETERQMREDELSFYSNSENEFGDDNIWGLLSGVGGNIYEWCVLAVVADRMKLGRVRTAREDDVVYQMLDSNSIALSSRKGNAEKHWTRLANYMGCCCAATIVPNHSRTSVVTAGMILPYTVCWPLKSARASFRLSPKSSN